MLFSVPVMDERGWGWSESEIRQAQLVEWIARQAPDTALIPEKFYAALPDRGMKTWNNAPDDLRVLEAWSLICLTVAADDIGGLQITAKDQVRDLAAEWRKKRANRPLRRLACRDAMMSWLWGHDAVTWWDKKIRDHIRHDARYSTWFAQPFSDRDLDEAAAWLHRQGLVEGTMVDQSDGPVIIYLTDEGARCAERFGGDTTCYLEAKERASASVPTVHIGGDYSGALQVAGDHAHQVQYNGASAEHLREMITGLAEMVRSLMPQAGDIDQEREMALAAATDGALDPSVLQRFARWVLSTVGKGAAAAVVPVVRSGTDDMLREVGRLTAHL